MLFDQLRALGVSRGDVLMVHASMRAVGGRAEDLVYALLEALGPSGTLLAYVDFERTDEAPEWDIERSPAAREYGALAEAIRRWPSGVRSRNPGASMVAIGARARWICGDHPLDYGYGPASPLAKLVEARGSVLLLGSHFDHVTLLHYAEHLAHVPDKRVVNYTVEIDGAPRTIEEFDTSEGVVDAMPERYFDQCVRDFVRTHRTQGALVGGALSYLLPAAELTAFATRAIERDFG